MKNIIHKFCWFIFALVVMIDPSGEVLGLKEKAFVGIFLISFFLRKLAFRKEPTSIFFIIISCAFISVVIGSIIYDEDAYYSFWYFKALMFISFFAVLSKYDYITIIKINALVGLFLSCIISILFLGYLLEIIPIDILPESNVFLSYRPFLGIPMTMFYYRTMPFCFFSLIYYLENKRYIFSFIILVSIIAGASRTPILCAICIILYVIYKNNRRMLKYAIGVFSLITIFLLLINLLSVENKISGDDIKYKLIGHLFSNSGLIPHGAGMPYWDVSRREFTCSTEVTYFEMLYQYGWILFPIMIYLLLLPCLKLNKYQSNVMLRDFTFAYFLYLVNAGTNPLLFSSTGMYVYACSLALLSSINNNLSLKYKSI